MNKLVARRRAALGPRNARLGITLLEIMIVLAIIGVVMGFLIGPAIFSKKKTADTRIAGIMVMDYANNAYGAWMLDGGKGCPTLEQLAKFSNDKKSEDPWGTQLKVDCGGSVPAGQILVVSAGPDKKFGTDDDVKSSK